MENMQIWLCPAEFGFTWQMTDEEKEEAKDIYERYIWDITRMVLQGNFSMLVMDEVIGACNAGLVNEDEFHGNFAYCGGPGDVFFRAERIPGAYSG